MPPILRKLLQSFTVTSVAGIGACLFWTRHCQVSTSNNFHTFSEPYFTSKWFRKFNPHNNPCTDDEVFRRMALSRLRPELVEDAKNGGTKLVESFSQGIWGSFGEFCTFTSVGFAG